MDPPARSTYRRACPGRGRAAGRAGFVIDGSKAQFHGLSSCQMRVVRVTSSLRKMCVRRGTATTPSRVGRRIALSMTRQCAGTATSPRSTAGNAMSARWFISGGSLLRLGLCRATSDQIRRAHCCTAGARRRNHQLCDDRLCGGGGGWGGGGGGAGGGVGGGGGGGAGGRDEPMRCSWIQMGGGIVIGDRSRRGEAMRAADDDRIADGYLRGSTRGHSPTEIIMRAKGFRAGFEEPAIRLRQLLRSVASRSESVPSAARENTRWQWQPAARPR